MNLTTLIQKKGAIFGLEKFTKALDEVFGIDSVLGSGFDNKATLDDSGRLVIQYRQKTKGCIVFQTDNHLQNDPYVVVKICKTKNPSEGLEWHYQTQTISTKSTVAQFKQFLKSVVCLHTCIANRVEIEQDIDKEIAILRKREQKAHEVKHAKEN